MAKRGIKKQEHEKLDDLTISRVINLLEQKSPITKKAACEILNISYNTARLAKIIQEYKDKIEYTRKRMEKNKGRPFSDLETKEIVIDYLSGTPISRIAANLFRTEHTIKAYIQKLNLPERNSEYTYQNPGLIPEEMISDSFEEKELAWSARYNSVVEIRKNIGNDIYRIWVFGKHMQNAYQPVYELGKLNILKLLNVTDTEFKSNNLNIINRIE